MFDPVPEFLKHFITGNATELFLALLALGTAGAWSLVRRLRRLAALPDNTLNAAPHAPAELLDRESVLNLSDSIDALTRRMDKLETLREFDSKLKGPS
jgi:hypothetical protein